MFRRNSFNSFIVNVKEVENTQEPGYCFDFTSRRKCLRAELTNIFQTAEPTHFSRPPSAFS